MRPAFVDIENRPDTLSGRAANISSLSGQCSPSEVPFSASLVEDAFSDLPTNLDVPQPNFSDQIAPSDPLFSSTEAPKGFSGQLFEDHASADGHASRHPINISKIHEGPIEPHKPQGECRTAAAALGLPSSTDFTATSRGESEQQSTGTRFGITSTVALSDRESAANVNVSGFPNTIVSLPHTNFTFKLTNLFRREHAASLHFSTLRT